MQCIWETSALRRAWRLVMEKKIIIIIKGKFSFSRWKVKILQFFKWDGKKRHIESRHVYIKKGNFQCKYRIRHVLFQVATHVDSGHTHRMPGKLMWTRSKCNWSNSKLDIRTGGSILCCIYIHTLNEHLMPLHLRGRKTRCPFFTWGMLHL